jgi:hypothetical protein
LLLASEVRIEAVITPILRMVEPVFAPEGRLILARHFRALIE